MAGAARLTFSPPAIWVDIRVLGIEWMAMLAHRPELQPKPPADGPLATGPPKEVLTRGNWLQVIGIDARPIPTQVIQD